MPRRITAREKIPQAIRRLARAALRKACDRLDKPDVSVPEQIHGVRTALKKVRALVRMVRRNAPGAAAENRKLRKIARSIGAVRDAEVLLRTFDKLSGDLPDRDSSLRKLRAYLSARRSDAVQTLLGKRGLRRIRRRLARARRRAKRWQPRSRGWRCIGPGAVRGYRRARHAMGSACASTTGAAFHAWRRAVKSHRHQLWALLDLWPTELGPRVDKLDRLGDLLGEEHDLTILATALEEHEQVAAEHRSRMLALLHARQAQLRARALALGRRLLAEDAASFRARLRRAFDSFGRPS